MDSNLSKNKLLEDKKLNDFDLKNVKYADFFKGVFSSV